MKLSEFDHKALAQQLAGHGLDLASGPFKLRIRSEAPTLPGQLQSLYPEALIEPPSTAHPTDFHLSLFRPRGLRRLLKPQIEVTTDGDAPFEPFPLDHALPLLEWSLNWVIASHAHQYLMLHAAVVERHGRALLMPAFPGSGKSTFSAALMLRGWRLLSDEFALIRPTDPELRIHPLPRPIALKNTSIEVIRQFSPEAHLGPTFPKTRKGDVAHLMASLDSQRRSREATVPACFVFVNYQAGAATELAPLAKGQAFLRISGNSFNYRLQGARGFQAVSALVERCPAYVLTYSDLEQAITQIENLNLEKV